MSVEEKPHYSLLKMLTPLQKFADFYLNRHQPDKVEEVFLESTGWFSLSVMNKNMISFSVMLDS